MWFRGGWFVWLAVDGEGLSCWFVAVGDRVWACCSRTRDSKCITLRDHFRETVVWLT